jgi:hypothetical protein
VIISDLEEDGYLTRSGIGRRHARTVNRDRPFRHRAEVGHESWNLIALCTGHDEARMPRAGLHGATDEGTPGDAH